MTVAIVKSPLVILAHDGKGWDLQRYRIPREEFKTEAALPNVWRTSLHVLEQLFYR